MTSICPVTKKDPLENVRFSAIIELFLLRLLINIQSEHYRNMSSC